MKSVAIVIGHGPVKDTGAVSSNGKVSELQWNRRLADYLFEACDELGIKATIVHRVKEKIPPVAQTNATGAASAIELHLNSATPKASGTEMIYCPGSTKGRAFAAKLQAAAVSVLKLPDRGVKTPYAGRGMGFLSKTKMPAVIVESFFISNDFDLKRGTDQRIALAAAFAAAIKAA